MILFIFCEILDYDLYYGFIYAGRMRMEKKDTVIDNDSMFLLTSVITSNPALSWLYKINDTLISVTDRNMKPFVFERRIHEKNFTLREKIFFDYEKRKIVYATGEEFPLPEDTYDILSIYYYMRTYGFSYTDTEEVFIHVSKRTEKYRMIKEDAGELKVKNRRYQCFKIKPVVLNSKKSKGRLMVSYITKKSKLPVLLVANMGIGSLRGILRVAK